ncbi:hypothetical protein QBC38DRAFT_526817 [Podospora fimiseda]|uniref:chitin synthase n=1 Tax=Podospora fimiseda TaxID=252190 RepID=A0AAN7GYU7_9PEZI|nr:hypothetical protein QBC38DRAFT_526817 [Podospora fimiseda]
MAASLSIVTGCVGLISTIGSVTTSITRFIRTVREAREDLESIIRELTSLKIILNLVQADASKPLPGSLTDHLVAIVGSCNTTILDLERVLDKYQDGGKRQRGGWAVYGKEYVEHLRARLENNTRSLNLALDYISLASTVETNHIATNIKEDTAEMKKDIAKLLQEIAQLKAQQMGQVEGGKDYILERYLEEMTTYTECALDSVEAAETETLVSEGVERPRTWSSSSVSAVTVSEALPPAPSSAALQSFSEDIWDILHQRKTERLAGMDELRTSRLSRQLEKRSETLSLAPSSSTIPQLSDRTDQWQYQRPRSRGKQAIALLLEKMRAREAKLWAFDPHLVDTLRTSNSVYYKLSDLKNTVWPGPYRGNFVQNFGVPHVLPPPMVVVGHGEDVYEFLYSRYTAVTCEPLEFIANNYLLRQQILEKPRHTALLISIFFDQCRLGMPESFRSVLKNIWDGLDELAKTANNTTSTTTNLESSSSSSSPFGPDGWKHVVLHIHLGSHPRGALCGAGATLNALKIKHMRENYLREDNPGFFSNLQEFAGRRVRTHMYEYTTQLTFQPEKKGFLRSSKPIEKTRVANYPTQMIITTPPGGTEGYPPYRGDRKTEERQWRDWRTTLRKSLQSDVAVARNFSEGGYGFKPDVFKKVWLKRGEIARSPFLGEVDFKGSVPGRPLLGSVFEKNK